MSEPWIYEVRLDVGMIATVLDIKRNNYLCDWRGFSGVAQERVRPALARRRHGAEDDERWTTR